MNDSLSVESFIQGAKKAAYKAMDDHARGEYDEFALHAGVAIERLAKAVLAMMNPLFIASGKVQIGPQNKVKVYTISATEALSRLQSLGVVKYDRDLKDLIEQRNGTVHAAGGEEAMTHVPTLAKAVAAMLEHLDIPELDFWDRWASAVNVVVDRQRNKVQRDVELRIKQARHLFDDRFAGLPPGAKEKVLHSSVPDDINTTIRQLTFGDPTLELALFIPAKCPACGGVAQLTIDSVTTSSTGAKMVPQQLSCSLCGLRLNGIEEILASGTDVERAQLPAEVSISWGPTLPFDDPFGETHAG
ncbi:hypothetical protein [Streptomyces sp. NPDC001642]|uniref:hypothetical protein n=1 Tax=Streptomyces sp. NPDC001642 TaxID=3154392 RepID=UPI00332DBB56